MKIAIFSDTFFPQINGVANTVKNSAVSLSKLGHEVSVYTLSAKKGNDISNEFGDLFPVITFPSSEIPVYPGERVTLPLGFSFTDISKFKPDIIHVHTPFAVGIEGVMASKIFKVPVVGTHHTFFDHYLKHVYLDYNWAKKFTWKGTVFFYNRMDRILSPSKSLMDELSQNGIKKPIEHLPNSVDKNNFKSQKNLENNTDLVYMGRVSYEKSIDDVIRALKEIHKENPEIKLKIIGDGPEKEKLKSLSKDLGIENQVIFTGFLHGQALIDSLSSAFVFITASRSENMPLAILEAESVGLPIVAISSLGMSEIVEDNGNGFLISPTNPEETTKLLASSVLKILNDKDLRKRFRERSIELAQKYSDEDITKKLLDIYQKTINLKKKK